MKITTLLFSSSSYSLKAFLKKYSNNEDDFEANTADAAVIPYLVGDRRIHFCISNNKVFSDNALVVVVASNKVFIEN